MGEGVLSRLLSSIGGVLFLLLDRERPIVGVLSRLPDREGGRGEGDLRLLTGREFGIGEGDLSLLVVRGIGDTSLIPRAVGEIDLSLLLGWGERDLYLSGRDCGIGESDLSLFPRE